MTCNERFHLPLHRLHNSWVTVTNNSDPNGLGRVRVMLNGLEDNHETDWAPVATLMAGDQRGSFFLPEVDDEVLVAFYDQRLPADIVSGRHFESWWKGLSAEELKQLELTEADVLQRPLDESSAQQYPDYLEWEGVKAEL